MLNHPSSDFVMSGAFKQLICCQKVTSKILFEIYFRYENNVLKIRKKLGGSGKGALLYKISKIIKLSKFRKPILNKFF